MYPEILASSIFAQRPTHDGKELPNLVRDHSRTVGFTYGSSAGSGSRIASSIIIGGLPISILIHLSMIYSVQNVRLLASSAVWMNDPCMIAMWTAKLTYM